MVSDGLVVIPMRKWHRDCKVFFYTDLKNMWSLEGTQRGKYVYVAHKSVTDSNAEI
jgi:hypothetical protein